MTTNKTCLVAVYGSLRKGFGNHGLIQDQECLGVEVTPPKYRMFNLGAFPAVSHKGDTPITIEVYRVSKETLDRLDILEGHPDFYRRGKVQTSHGKAWMYFMDDLNPSVCTQRVASGDWSRRDEDARPF